MDALPGIHYLSHHEVIGYGVAGRRLIHGLEQIGCRVKWTPLTWAAGGPFIGAGIASEVGLDRLRDVELDPDLVIIHTLPESVPDLERARRPGVPFVLHTVWEHEVLQPHWPELINRCDAVIVPTEWNAAAFRRDGVTIPVLVVPHAHDGGADGRDTSWLDGARPGRSAALTLHSIATWSARKAPWHTLTAYAKAFSPRDDVLLAMRTTSALDHDVPAPDGPEHRRRATSWSAAQLMGRYAPAPALHLITDRLSFAQLSGLRHLSGGWISLPHCEGWDLGCFDAAVAGCPVITTGYGGPLAYLDPDRSALIPGELVELDWLPGARWVEPDIEAAVQALRALHADPDAARERAEAQAIDLRARFAPAVVADLLLARLRDSHTI